jgi:prevent-host-death family protein
MPAAVSAADANREFSKLLRRVRQGQAYVITSHGQAVAKIVPISGDDKVRAAARTALFKRLRSPGKQRRVNVGRWTRDELYAR